MFNRFKRSSNINYNLGLEVKSTDELHYCYLLMIDCHT